MNVLSPEIIELYNHNKRYLDREISLSRYLALEAEYATQGRHELAVALTRADIRL